jgi:hypothetical protein
LARARSNFDTKFRFSPPGAPCFQGLVERFVDATKATVHSAVHEEFQRLDGSFSKTSIVVSCSTTEAVHLGVIDCVDTLSFLLMAGGSAGFGGGDSAVQDMARRVVLTWRERIPIFDTKFLFTHRGAPRLSDVSVDCAARSGADVRFSPLALGKFLMGSAYAKLQQIEKENIKLTKVTKHKRVCSIFKLFYERLMTALSTHLDGWVSRTAE